MGSKKSACPCFSFKQGNRIKCWMDVKFVSHDERDYHHNNYCCKNFRQCQHYNTYFGIKPVVEKPVQVATPVRQAGYSAWVSEKFMEWGY